MNNELDTKSKRIYEIVNNWLEVVEGGDPTQIANLYAEQGVLLGTVAENVKQGRSVIKTYFDMFVQKNPQGTLNSIIFKSLGDKHGIADGNYTFMLDDKEGRNPVRARFTFVINLESELIETHHSSSTPAKPSPTDF